MLRDKTISEGSIHTKSQEDPDNTQNDAEEIRDDEEQGKDEDYYDNNANFNWNARMSQPGVHYFLTQRRTIPDDFDQVFVGNHSCIPAANGKTLRLVRSMCIGQFFVPFMS